MEEEKNQFVHAGPARPGRPRWEARPSGGGPKSLTLNRATGAQNSIFSKCRSGNTWDSFLHIFWTYTHDLDDTSAQNLNSPDRI